VDHKSSKPLTRDLKHVPTPSQAVATKGGVGNSGLLDGVRKIGAPGGGVGSPLANRGSYKPPTFKRGVDGRPPLGDLPANGPIGDSGGGGDVKRQRLNG
jgi:DNA repair and recombination protein RAD52